MHGQAPGDRVAGGMPGRRRAPMGAGQTPPRPRLLPHPLHKRPLRSRPAFRAVARRLGSCAVKVGQLGSMDAGSCCCPSWARSWRACARCQTHAHWADGRVLTAAWGAGWDARFAQFGFTPIAVASIGRCTAPPPKMGGHWPSRCSTRHTPEHCQRCGQRGHRCCACRACCLPIVMGPLLAEAKRQLHEEADYLREARCQADAVCLAGLLAGAPNLRIPPYTPTGPQRTCWPVDYAKCVPIERRKRAPGAARRWRAP